MPHPIAVRCLAITIEAPRKSREMGDRLAALDGIREPDENRRDRTVRLPHQLRGERVPGHNRVGIEANHLLHISPGRSVSAAAHRSSICRFLPSLQSNACRPARSDAIRACASRSAWANPATTPIRRIRFCCARARRGPAHHGAADERDELAPFTRSSRRRAQGAGVAHRGQASWRSLG
jgi:hypothetical protein